MEIYEDGSTINIKKGCVLALGNFDGVHEGHRKLLKSAREYADKNDLDFGIYTFSEHTRLGKNAAHELLTLGVEKNSLFECEKADFVYFENFERVKNMTPEEFCDYIVQKLFVRCAFCGENFTFGKNASGKSEDLIFLMKKKGENGIAVPSVEIDGITVSSSEIRRLIRDGDTETAKKFLGYPYTFSSVVIDGKRLGRTIGFPTINQQIPQGKVVPKSGVYATVVCVDGKEYVGVTDIGTKPTVSAGKNEVLAETHIVGFCENIYGKTVTLSLFKNLRDEKKFSGISELTENIALNVQQSKAYFKGFNGYEK